MRAARLSASSLAIGSVLLTLVASCTAGGTQQSVQPNQSNGYNQAFGQPATYSPAPATTQVNPATGQNEILLAQQRMARKVEITVDARVYKLLADDTEGLPHQRFLILLNNNSTVLIAHDTKFAPRVPLNQGDLVRIHGEYIWNNKGGVVHWTHHSNGRHEGGWIDYKGQRYQ